MIKHWEDLGTKHPVYLAEILPLAVAAATWQNRLAGRRVLFFLDNEAARSAAIRGFTMHRAAATLVSGLWAAITKASADAWFAHVPSSSNPADRPSRLLSVPSGWVKVRAAVPASLSQRDWFA